jgi:hypothetical protein
MRRFLVSALISALAAGWFVVAAGPSAAASCEVLKRREVEKAIGRKVKIGPAADGVGGECSFSVRGAPLDVVKVWVLEGDDATTGYKVGAQLASDDATHPRGIGDKAVYTGEPFNTLYVLDGETLVYVQYYLVSGDDSPAKVRRAVVQMTKKVLKRV